MIWPTKPSRQVVTTVLRDMLLGAVAAVVLLLLLVLRASITNPDAAWGILAAPIVALFGAALGLPIGLIIRWYARNK